ncbi:hypothetical protein [Cellulomonas bogoriensis]|uniref:Uncharacterized protein n=1 Tax=Cellulomonas bogoriensis 69B4 = DSM 16987 TaxID=1386082 RepID=A0A0A0C0E6_9CELL|nr:hypothetical protein [Cellulomonas bogoriensis]KGM13417.1 hypothetical protein N869_14190 [Cellulomonas bogoriensis 69B4 = DSM 16987]
MPSYRVRMVLGDLHAGVDPADVLPAAVGAARGRTAVEAGQVDVRQGQAMVTVRFEAPDDLEASSVGRAVVTHVDTMVVVETSRVMRRAGARWYPLR